MPKTRKEVKPLKKPIMAWGLIDKGYGTLAKYIGYDHELKLATYEFYSNKKRMMQEWDKKYYWPVRIKISVVRKKKGKR